MTFQWLNIWVIGATTSGAVGLLWYSRLIERLEGCATRRHFRKPKPIVLPFEHKVDDWLKYCHVTKMNAKQWYGVIVGSLIYFPLLGMLIPHHIGLIKGAVGGIYIAVSVIWHPFQKRKKFNLDMELQIQRAKRMLAKLYARNIRTDEMLPILIEALEDGPFKDYVHQAIQRTKSTDTLSAAIQWMSDEIRLPSLQSLATVMVQGTQYANLPLDQRLRDMAKRDRDKTLINHEKLADERRIRALIEAGSLIALPLISLLALFIFEYVFKMFTTVHL